MVPISRKTIETAISGLAVFSFFLFPFFFFRQTAIDDAFITARHSSNLARGFGLVFNPGEWVLGTTTPLWGLLTNWIFFLPVSNEAQGFIVSLFGGVLAITGVYFFSRFFLTKYTFNPWLLTLGIIIIPATSDSLVMGMETGILIFSAAWFLILLFDESQKAHLSHWVKISILAFLILLIRLDSVFFLAAFGFSYLLFERSFPTKHVIGSVSVALVLTVLWLLICFMIYGSPLPHSMIAKSGFSQKAGFSLSPFLFSWWQKTQQLLRLDFPWPRWIKVPLSFAYSFLVLGSMVIPFLAWKSLTRAQKVLVSGTVLYLLSYSLFFTIGRAGIFPWYAHLSCFLWFGTLLSLAISFPRTGPMKLIARGFTFVILFLALLMQGISFWGLFTLGDTNKPGVSLGLFLKSKDCQSVMLEPIGYIGFFSDCRKVYDLAGLVSPEVLSFRQNGKPGWFFDAVKKFEPEYIVLRRGEVEKNLGFNVGVLFESERERSDFLRRYSSIVSNSDWEGTYEVYGQR